MKIRSEEIYVIINNLVAIGLLTRVYDVGNRTMNITLSKRGVQAYSAILSMIGESKLFSGPFLNSEQIDINTLESVKDLMLDEQFVTQVSDNEDMTILKYALTKRGAEHMKVMLDIGVKGKTKPHVALHIKLFGMFKHLKG